MSTCASSNCGYYWQDENDDYPRCHFDGFGKAPCEEDDWDEPDRYTLADLGNNWW